MTAKKITAIYPGTFDPPTNGHLDIIERASKLYSRVIVAVAKGSGKNTWFSVQERKKMLEAITKKRKNIEIDNFDELLVSYAKRKGACVIIRGLRALSDFEYEFQMALTNRSLAPDLETVFLMTHENYSYLSSSLIKEISSLHGNLSRFVPKVVEDNLKKRNKP
jgi:pantetheine-phosphate adenylyltransferase